MPRTFVIKQPQKEVKNQVEEVKEQPVSEIKIKRRTTKKIQEEAGDLWEERQESSQEQTNLV